jgi:hypothetical protein
VACRHCNDLWYAAQRISSTAREVFDETKNPPEARRLWPNPKREAAAPRRMWRRTYERYCAALARIEGNLFA